MDFNTLKILEIEWEAQIQLESRSIVQQKKSMPWIHDTLVESLAFKNLCDSEGLFWGYITIKICFIFHKVNIYTDTNTGNKERKIYT